MKAKDIAKVLQVGTRTNLSLDALLYRADLRSEYLDDTVSFVFYGVAWAYGTLRLGVTAEMALHGLTSYQVCKLVAEMIADGVTVANDVPRWLNNHFA